ncbi:hypothetical protein B0H19DRAFT_1182348 [Mycena capillaripes]|nr:hypothetical protein B0H19DRAFT_1182348 [Mycena capillaripes]
MQLLAAITTSLMLVTSTTAASLTLFTGTGFTGQSATLISNGECGLPINQPFISRLLSAKASDGDICFLYKDVNDCSDCAACVDADGFSDMTAVPAVQHFRCVTADSQGCSNAACDFH